MGVATPINGIKMYDGPQVIVNSVFSGFPTTPGVRTSVDPCTNCMKIRPGGTILCVISYVHPVCVESREASIVCCARSTHVGEEQLRLEFSKLATP